MSTLTFQTDDEKAKRLEATATKRGISVEKLLAQIVDEFLRHDAFKKATNDSTTENEEFLRRLAK